MKARVLTAEEIQALPRLAIVFIEYFDGELQRPGETIFAGMKCYDGTIVNEDACVFSDFEKDMKPSSFDGSYWRFWNRMPTEEERREIPWPWCVYDE